jgi:uroporphyrinogen-III synthase
VPLPAPVILTREAEDNEALQQELAAWSIPAVSYPCLATEYIPAGQWAIEPPADPRVFRVVLITSRRGVRGLCQDASLLHSPELIVAAVGRSTAAALREDLDREPNLVAADARSIGLAQELSGVLRPGEAVLHVRGSKSNGELKSVLTRRGFKVHEMIVYRNVDPGLEPLDIPGPWVVVLASPSAMHRFMDMNGSYLADSRFVAIGPTTAKALRDLGFGTVHQARSPQREDLAAAIKEAWEAQAPIPPASGTPQE